jgi:hypothetical protein
MTYPFGLWMTRQPSSDLPFMAVLCAAIWLWVTTLASSPRTAGRFFLVGLAIGFAMLMRPIAIGLGGGLALLTWLGLRERAAGTRTAAVAMILAGNLLVIAPWEIWVYQKTSSVIPLSTAGLPAIRDGLTFAVRDKGRAGVWVPEDVRSVMTVFNSRYSELTSFGAVAAIIRQQLRERPMGVVKLYLVKVARSWYGTDSQRFDRPILFVQLFYLAALVWCARLAWRRPGWPRQALVGIACLVVYFQVMNLVGLTLLRYSVPVIGLTMVLLPALVPRRWAGQNT